MRGDVKFVWGQNIATIALSHSTVVYRDCHGWSSIIAIHKEISVFTFSFSLNLSSKDIKVENR